MKRYLVVLVLCVGALSTSPAFAEVLGLCGTPDAEKPTAILAASGPAGSSAGTALTVARIPLPGDQAPNFELDAVVGKEVQKIKLSDYDGKWRVVCFYPADFTFV